MQRIRQIDTSLWYALILFACLLALGGGIGFVRRRWDRLHAVLTPRPRRKQPARPAEPDDTSKSGSPNEPNGQVSAEELI